MMDHWDSHQRELLVLVWVWTVVGLLDLAFFGVAGTARGWRLGPAHICSGGFIIVFWWAFRAAVRSDLNRRSRNA